MINVNDGHVTLVVGDVAIHCGMTIDELKPTKTYKENMKQIRDLGSRYIWYDFLSQEIEGLLISPTMCMKDGVLQCFQFMLHHHEYQSVDPRKDWSIDWELRMQDLQDHFLVQLFNRLPDKNTNIPIKRTIYYFSWGTVWSVNDWKSGFNSIVLWYNPISPYHRLPLSSNIKN